MSEVDFLLHFGRPRLDLHEELLRTLANEINPPTAADFAPTLANLLDLQEALGDGWEIPVVSGARAQSLDLLSQLSQLDLPLPPTDNIRGHVGSSPIWATLQGLPIGWNSPSCVLAFSFYLDRNHRDYAAKQLRLILRTLEKVDGDISRAEMINALSPAPTATSFYDDFYDLDIRHAWLARFIPFKSMAYIRKIPELKAHILARSTQGSDQDEAESEESTDVYSEQFNVHPDNSSINESFDEELTGPTWVELDDETSAYSLCTQFVHAGNRYRSYNRLYLEQHPSSLSSEEASEVARWLIRQATASASTMTPALVAVTMLITGRNAVEALEAMTVSPHASARLRYRLGTECLHVALPPLPNAFIPAFPQKWFLLNANQELDLPIPAQLDQLVYQWQQTIYHTLGTDYSPTEEVAALLAEFRTTQKIPVFPAQLSKTIGNLLVRESGDPVIAQWITGDFNSHSDGPLYYVTLKTQHVANIFAKTVWSLISPFESPPRARNKNDWVGANSRITPDHLKQIQQSLCDPFKARFSRADSVGSAIKRHNQMVDYVTHLLVCFVGHRPVNNLLRLNRWDFDLDDGIALFSDKHCDPAHFLRPVALGKELTNQLNIFRHHLQKFYEIVKSSKNDRTIKIARAIRKAQRGDSPWFFWLANNGAVRNRSIRWWNKEFKKRFPYTQPNFGRTLLASRFRELNAEHLNRPGQPSLADLAHIQLGHLELSGYPFDSNSPTDLLAIASAAGPLMDELFKLQGWKSMGGLVTYAERRSGPSYEPADWFDESNARHWRKRRHRAWKARLRESRQRYLEQAHDIFADTLLLRLENSHPELARQIKRQIDPGTELNEISQPLELSQDELKQILSSVEGKKNRAIQTNILESVLRSGREDGWYSGPLPRRYAPVLNAEVTRFLPGMFKARGCIQLLRMRFAESTDHDASTSTPALPFRPLARLVIALILYGGVTNREILDGIVNHRGEAVKNPKFPDGLLVPVPYTEDTDNPTATGRPPAVWALWHLAAIALLDFNKASHHCPVLDDQRLESDDLDQAIEAELSNFIKPPPKPKKWIEALLQQASVVALIERSGIGEFSLDPERGSWSLALTRQFALLKGTQDRYTKPQKKPIEEKSQPSASPDLFLKRLRNLLPKEPSKKATSQVSGAAKGRRTRAIKNIERLLQPGPSPQLEWAIAKFAVSLLVAKKSDGNPLAFSTINGYFGAVADRLAQQLKSQDLMELGYDEYVDIYCEIINGTSQPEMQIKVIRGLLRFHSVLEEHFSAPPVDRACLTTGGESLTGRVDARALLTTEKEKARSKLESTFINAPRGYWRGDFSTGQRGLLVYDLLAATGARTGEIVGLKRQDIYEAGGKIWLLIRRNLYRSLKTKRARRKICLSNLMESDASQQLEKYLAAQDQDVLRLTSPAYLANLLFIDRRLPVPGCSTALLNLSDTRQMLTQAIQSLAPDHPRLYQMRHSLATSWQMQMAISTGPKGLMCLIPKHAADVMQHLGHGKFKITNRCYGHLPWAYLYPQAQACQEVFDSRAAYYIIGKSRQAADRAKSRHPGTKIFGQSLKQLGYTEPPKVRRKRGADQIQIAEFPSKMPDAACFLIDCVRSGQPNPEKYGISSAHHQAFVEADKLVANCTGISFFDRALSRAAFPRLYVESQDIWLMAALVYKRPAQMHTLLSGYLELSDSMSSSRVRLKKGDVKLLKDLLVVSKTGLKTESIDSDYFKEELKATDPANRNATALLAWTLSLCATLMHGRSEIDSSSAWKKRALFA